MIFVHSTGELDKAGALLGFSLRPPNPEPPTPAAPRRKDSGPMTFDQAVRMFPDQIKALARDFLGGRWDTNNEFPALDQIEWQLYTSGDWDEADKLCANTGDSPGWGPVVCCDVDDPERKWWTN